MSHLYIIGKIKSIDLEIQNTDYIYYFGDSRIDTEATCLNNSKEINRIALELKYDYTDYINSINHLFIKNSLVYENNISTFFFTDLFNKRTEIFDTYVSICHLLFLKEKISSGLNIDRIYAIDCTDMVVQSLKSAFPNLVVNDKSTKAVKFSLTSFNYLQLKFFIKTIIQVFIIKIYYSKKHNEGNIDRLFLTRYPLHFNKAFKEEKYGNMVGEKDWFLISMLTDGMHQSIKLKDTSKYAKYLTNKTQVILLDVYLNIGDIFNALLLHYRYLYKLKVLMRQQYLFKDIDISKFIHKELQQSFQRLPRLFMYHNALMQVFSINKIKEFVFYLHEYSYGRFFNYILANYFSQIKRIGFQHGPASSRKLLYYLAKNKSNSSMKDWLHQCPLPNKVLAEDELSKSIYEEAGYNNVELMDEIYRLDYLKYIERKENEFKQVLIVPGLHDWMSVLDYIIDDVRKNKDTYYLLKPHPRSRLAKLGIPDKYNSPNLNFVNGHISQYLAIASEVIATYSSVGYEAYLLGIPVKVICLSNKINESPLLDIYEKEMRSDKIEILW